MENEDPNMNVLDEAEKALRKQLQQQVFDVNPNLSDMVRHTSAPIRKRHIEQLARHYDALGKLNMKGIAQMKYFAAEDKKGRERTVGALSSLNYAYLGQAITLTKLDHNEMELELVHSPIRR